MATTPPPRSEAGVAVVVEDSSPELAASLRPAWLNVDLDALERNPDRLRRRVAPTQVLAVLKADAYGHGAVPVGRALATAGVDWLGVALLEEGIELRRGGGGGAGAGAGGRPAT